MARYAAENAGIRHDAIILDPGLGFAKQARHSYEALASLERLDQPPPAPAQRSVTKVVSEGGAWRRVPFGAEWGSAAAVTASVLLGAHIVGIHGVRESVQVDSAADCVLAAIGTPARRSENFGR